MDILDEYIKISGRRLDAPKIFIQSAGYHVISSLLGRFFRCSAIPGTPEIGLRPNTWFIISSIPGRTRRSTVSNQCVGVYKGGFRGYLKEISPSLVDTDINKILYNSIIEEGTVEGIMDHIEKTGLKEFSIVSSEFGSVMSNIQNKDYQKGVSTLLSKLYYGEGGSMMLSQKGKDSRGIRHIEEGLYVTMFAGMQEPHLYITPIMIRQGLLRRIILIYCKPDDFGTWKPPVDPYREEPREQFKLIINELILRMVSFRQASEGQQEGYINVQFLSDAYKVINDYSKRFDDEVAENESDYGIYMQGYWEHLSKLSILNAISRTDHLVETDNVFHIVVNIGDVKKAKEFLDNATKNVQEVIHSLGLNEEAIKSVKVPVERLFSTIKEAGPEGIKHSSLMNKHRYLSSDDAIRHLNTLINQDRIKAEIKSCGGRNATIYTVV